MRLLFGTVALLIPTLAYAQPVSSYAAGAAERTAYEDWFAGLSGDYRTGVEFWVSHRSLPKEATCFASNMPSASDWMHGCLQAQQRFTSLDARRKSDPDYRLGWNSVQSPEVRRTLEATRVPIAPSIGPAAIASSVSSDLHMVEQLQSCRQLASSVARLDCYDKLSAGTGEQSASSNHASPTSQPESSTQETTFRQPEPPAASTPLLPIENRSAPVKSASNEVDVVSKEDRDNAAKMHATVANFLAAKAKYTDATVNCQQAAADAATYGSRKDWMPNNTWYLEGDKIVIVGKDLQVKNAFNAQRYVTYVCKFDMMSNKAELVGME